MPFTQDNRNISIGTPLGPDALMLRGFSGTEGISMPFSFELDLVAEKPVTFMDIIGQNVTLSILLVDDTPRYFNGIISRFSLNREGSQRDLINYTATMSPWFWLLSRTSDSRIFQKLSIPDIVEQIFSEKGFSDYKLSLQDSYEPREYCVQYRETDMNFVSRLLEQEGIFYFFEHEDGKHTLNIADNPDAHQPCPKQESATYHVPSGGEHPEKEVVTVFDPLQEIRFGKTTLSDFNFTIPNTDMKVSEESVLNLGPGERELYDAPAEFATRPEGEKLVVKRMQMEEVRITTIHGESTCRAFNSGFRFDMEGLVDLDEYEGNSYVLTAVTHEAFESVGTSGSGGGNTYSNRFTCIPHDVPFRPEFSTPKPMIGGVQTAIVVGPDGEEIHTDEYGRVKVQFHWDREGKQEERKENSSCWIRVSQVWAGAGWGGMTIPRIGHEVIVDFIEGDPDRPIITGRVYQANTMPPYTLPADKTKSTIKSESSPGGEGFNELRFEDKKGSEEVFLHGEKDWNIQIKNSENETVGSSISTNAGASISRSAGTDISRTADDNITDKAGKNITTESGKNMGLKAGGSYQLLTNLGIHLKAMNFVAALIESGAKQAAQAIQKGAAKTAMAAGAAAGQAGAGGAGAAASAAGGAAATGGEATGMQALAALSPAIESGVGELQRLSDQAAASGESLSAPVNQTIQAADSLGDAVASGAAPEAIAEAAMAMVAAAALAFEDAKKLVEEMLPQIPSIVMWAMKDISARALWSMSLSTKVKDISISAENKDINVKAKKNINMQAEKKSINVKAKESINLEAEDKDLNVKASKKNLNITAKEALNIKAEDKKLVIEAGTDKVFIKSPKQIFLKCGSASISMAKSGNIVIKGNKINIKGSAPVQVKGTPIKLN